MLIFRLNLKEKRLDILPIGKHMDNLKIKTEFTSIDSNALGTNVSADVNTNLISEPTRDEAQLKYITLNTLNNQSFSFKVLNLSLYLGLRC